ncbi:MAG: response regulator transcription factor [Pseudomonadota bacterium]
MNILIAEDDHEISDYIMKGLREAGHNAQAVDDGDTALIEASHGTFDVLIVDRMLPGTDGLSIVRALRAMGKDTPVLILSALGEVDHRVEGLRAGSDDYLSKPFAFSEVLARVEALGRRQRDVNSAPTQLRVGDLVLDKLTRSATRNGTEIELLPREYALLEYLMDHAEQIVTRTMLLEKLWGLNFDPQTNIVDVHISRLRQKIDREFDTPLIHTVRGMGYVVRG